MKYIDDAGAVVALDKGASVVYKSAGDFRSSGSGFVRTVSVSRAFRRYDFYLHIYGNAGVLWPGSGATLLGRLRTKWIKSDGTVAEWNPELGSRRTKVWSKSSNDGWNTVEASLIRQPQISGEPNWRGPFRSHHGETGGTNLLIGEWIADPASGSFKPSSFSQEHGEFSLLVIGHK